MLIYCCDCGCIGGKTKLVEIAELDYTYAIEVCLECGSEDTIKYERPFNDVTVPFPME